MEISEVKAAIELSLALICPGFAATAFSYYFI